MSMKLREKTRENRVNLAKSRKPALWRQELKEVTARFGRVRGFDVSPECFQWKLGCSRLERKIGPYKAPFLFHLCV